MNQVRLSSPPFSLFPLAPPLHFFPIPRSLKHAGPHVDRRTWPNSILRCVVPCCGLYFYIDFPLHFYFKCLRNPQGAGYEEYDEEHDEDESSDNPGNDLPTTSSPEIQVDKKILQSQ